ncbi:MAG: hypothetical protein U9R74_09105 [Pseudomonadota bacterium]|nr:hypothetical protein [Pseudomonadota bacterium]
MNAKYMTRNLQNETKTVSARIPGELYRRIEEAKKTATRHGYTLNLNAAFVEAAEKFLSTVERELARLEEASAQTPAS